MTILTDAFSRRCLALYLTFDAPSYRSCMMILRDCVRRGGRLPQIIVIDGGPEFQGTYFETLLARYECTKKTRPPAKARFGSVCERLFGTTNTQFIHNLRGNTQITRNVRQVTKGNAPVGQAAWTLGCLYDYLSMFLFEIYDTIGHPALGQSPREAYLAGVESAGYRPNRVIAYDQEFLMATLPTTPRGTAKVSPGRGIIINHIYYWAEPFRDPTIEGHEIAVRYDPFDIGIAYAFVKNRWTECCSEHHLVLKDRSEKEGRMPPHIRFHLRTGDAAGEGQVCCRFDRHADAERRTPSDHLHAVWPRAVQHERQDDDRNDSLRAQGHSPPYRISNGAGAHRGHDPRHLRRARE